MNKHAAMAEVLFYGFLTIFPITMGLLMLWALITHGKLSW